MHSPFDFPQVGGKGFAVESQKEVFVAIGATHTTSTDKVKSMPRESRKCIKHDENLSQYPDITLEVFKNYSREACLLECQARKIQELCGCLPYYYPDFSRLWKKNTDCNLEGLRCLANISGKVDLIFKPLRYLDTL